MSHLFRPQRGSLAEAMHEVKEFDGTKAGLEAIVGYPIDVVKYYGMDKRIGWNTYIVIGHIHDETAVLGFTNGPLMEE